MTKKGLSTKMIEMKGFFPPALIALGLIFVIGAIGFWSYNQQAQNPSPAPLPEQVAGVPLKQSLVAKEAIAEFTRLHGSDFPLTSGAVGRYGSDHSVTLWVAGAPSQTSANRMLVAMRDKIAKNSSSSPFLPVGERQDGSRTVYELEGMGQRHFYFQSGKLIVWLAVDPERAEEILTQTLNFYP